MTEQEISKLEDLLDLDEGLSGKELDFICNLDESWRDRELSEKQSDWLSSIWSRKFES